MYQKTFSIFNCKHFQEALKRELGLIDPAAGGSDPAPGGIGPVPGGSNPSDDKLNYPGKFK
jgi:hypothetical protein